MKNGNRYSFNPRRKITPQISQCVQANSATLLLYTLPQISLVQIETTAASNSILYPI